MKQISRFSLDAEGPAQDPEGKFVYVFPSRTFAVHRIDIDGDALVLHGSSAGEGRYRVEVADVWGWRGRRPGLRAMWCPA